MKAELKLNLSNVLLHQLVVQKELKDHGVTLPNGCLLITSVEVRMEGEMHRVSSSEAILVVTYDTDKTAPGVA